MQIPQIKVQITNLNCTVVHKKSMSKRLSLPVY